MSVEDFAQSKRVDLALHRVLAVLGTRKNIAAYHGIDARRIHVWTGDRCIHGMNVFVVIDPDNNPSRFTQ